MKTIIKLFGIFVLAIGMLWLWNDGFFVRLMPSYIKKEKLSEKYGGVYVFYPEFREEIKKRERERQKEDDKLYAVVTKKAREKMKKEYGFTDEDIQKANTSQGDYFKKKQYNEVWNQIYRQVYAGFEEKYPQILSNGCTYHNQAFGPYREYFEPYYEKIKEFVGEEAYKKLKLSLRTTSFYECGDGKKVIITIYTDILDIYTQYGLFGDEG
ncbi:hypothetical protein, partial [Helicobacter kayseriensis]|uniref:hypothetical protein n=1 Tax=Helicobacter kayseriensis TaxID=2905877 RepID=UPI001E3B8C91